MKSYKDIKHLTEKEAHYINEKVGLLKDELPMRHNWETEREVLLRFMIDDVPVALPYKNIMILIDLLEQLGYDPFPPVIDENGGFRSSDLKAFEDHAQFFRELENVKNDERSEEQ